MLFQEPSKEKKVSQKTLIFTIILSLIFGSFAGAGSSFLIFQNLDKFGYSIKGEDGLKIEKIETITLIEEDSATIDAVENSQPSVVSIIISKDVATAEAINPFGDFFDLGPFGFRLEQPQKNPKSQLKEKRIIGGGTGFIVSSDGLVLTNKHVVIDDSAEYEVITNDGQSYPAQVLAKDTINDLAVIKIDSQDLQPLPLGDSDQIEIGQTVIAIGNALSEFKNTVTRGVVSGINRRVEAGGNGFSEVIEEAIQTDAAINPGNSGGPLLDLKGNVIGINTAISQQGQLVGFAIPVNEAKRIIDSIEKYGKIVRPFLGVRYMIINKQIAAANGLAVDYGALIIKGTNIEDIAIVPGSPADKAGLEANDIILEVGGQKIDENHSLARVLSKYNPGDEVELKILHDGEEKFFSVTLDERKDQ